MMPPAARQIQWFGGQSVPDASHWLSDGLVLQFCACLPAADYLLQVTIQITIFIIIIINIYTMPFGSKVFRYTRFCAFC